MKINIFGDIVSSVDISKLNIGPKLRTIICSADFNICNLEAPIKGTGSPIEKSGPNLFQDPSVFSWLKCYGFNIVSLANNHAFDFGAEGYFQTKKALATILSVGAGDWSDAYRPLIIENDGVRVGIIAFSHCEFGTLTDKNDSRYSYGTAWINHPMVNQIVIETKAKVDYLIALPHAGYEHIEQPLPEWVDRYHSLIDFGCDAIIASHPHIPQPIEIYNGKTIAYSLGNFYFPTSKPYNSKWYKSLGISIDICNNAISCESIPLSYSSDSIDIDSSLDTIQYLKRINETFSNKNEYISYINQKCQDLLDNYYPEIKENRKTVIDRLKLALWFYRHPETAYYPRLPIQNIPYLINSYRCESHRWLIARALKNKFDIQ